MRLDSDGAGKGRNRSRGGRARPTTGACIRAASAFLALFFFLPAAAPVGAQQGSVLHSTRLSELGYPEGIAVTRAFENRDVYFPGAPGIPVTGGSVRLEIRTQMQNFQYAFLLIHINGVPRQSLSVASLSDSTFSTVLPLTEEDLAQPSVQISFRFGGRLVEDACYDPRTNGSYVHLLGESAVSYRYRPSDIETVSAAWSVLPRHVTVALPDGELEPLLYESAWRIGSALERAGRRIRYVALPSAQEIAAALDRDAAPSSGSDWLLEDSEDIALWMVGDSTMLARRQASTGFGLVVAADAATLEEIESAIPPGAAVRLSPPGFPERANLRLARAHGRSFVIVTEPLSAEGAELMSERWRALALAPRAFVQPTVAASPIQGRRLLRFDDIGISPMRNQVVELSDWLLPFTVQNLPGGRMPTAVELEIVAGVSPLEKPAVMHALLNDVLVQSFRLLGDGEVQRIRIELPPRLMQLDNQLRLQMQRQPPDLSGQPIVGQCRLLPSGIPVQLLGSSVLFTEGVGAPNEFFELLSLLRDGFVAYLPEDFRQRPLETVPFLARAGATALPLTALEQVIFYESDGVMRPDGRFVLLGDGARSGVDAPVKVEDGRVTLDVGPESDRIVDVTSHPDAVLSQVATIGDQEGLWIDPLGQGAISTPSSMFLSDGNVALVTSLGVEISYDSRIWERDEWLWLLVILQRYRFVLVGFGLLAAGVLLIVLLRYLRRRRAEAGGAAQ